MLAALVAELRPYFNWAPTWLFSLAVLIAALAAALLAHAAIVRVVRARLHVRDSFWPSVLVRTRNPSRLAFAIFALSAAAAAAPLSSRLSALIQHALLIGFVLLVGWILSVILDIGANLYLRPLRRQGTGDLLMRKHITQVRILRRAGSIVIGIVTVAMALMTIEQVRQWGVSLLAAGGAAGVIVGLALQPMLSNLMAGLQIATTQPIRLGDQVLVEGEVGFVEEITATYVVLRIWDERRMVLPLSYFLQKPFQNWTRENPQMLGTVMLYVDYRTPVDRVRRKLGEVAKTCPKWDGRVAVLQVTDANPRVLELRCLVSAADAGALFDLRCEVRERLVAFLSRELPEALPRERVSIGEPLADLDWTRDPATAHGRPQ